MIAMSDCPFCPLEKKTTWHWERGLTGDEKVVICEDLDDKGHKLRLLCVVSNRHSDDPWPAMLGMVIIEQAEAIAEELKSEVEWTESYWDGEMSYPGHYHLQLVLD